MVAALVSRTDSITTLPAEFITATEIVSLCTSMPMYFVLSMRGCSFSLRDEANHVAHPKNYPQKGALLECVVTYLVRPPLTVNSPLRRDQLPIASRQGCPRQLSAYRLLTSVEPLLL